MYKNFNSVFKKNPQIAEIFSIALTAEWAKKQQKYKIHFKSVYIYYLGYITLVML